MAIPTEAMASEARRGLEWRAEFGRGGTGVGVARARDISNRKDLSDDTIGRMVSYFARHEVDKQAEGFSPGEDGYPSAGRIAWALWGGDPGQSWANAQWRRIQREREERMSRKAGPNDLSEGDFVSWNSSGGRARGQIEHVMREGTLGIPDTDFSIEATPEDPAALIRIWRDSEPTEILVGHKFSTLTKINDLRSRQPKGFSMNIHKNVSLTQCQVKFMGEESLTFEGYASVFGGLDSYNDTILRGAYSDLLEKMAHGEEEMPKMFLNHRAFTLPIGKWTKLEEDQYGLKVQGEFTPGNFEARNVRAAMQHGTVDGLSIGFMLGEHYMDEDEEGNKVRVIKSIKALPEISIVTYPADDAARVDLASVKTSLDQIQSLADYENFLREVGGFSKSLATAAASVAKRLAQGEPVQTSNLPIELQRQIYANLLISKTL